MCLAPCPCPGQKCTIATLSLMITMRALCSPCHFNLKMARKENGLGQSFEPDPWRRRAPSPEHSSSSPTSEPRALAFVSLPASPLLFQVLPFSPRTSLLLYS